ncbi:MAG TPA: ABC transporter ATP-binding protein [Acidimicrobiales bacterium]|nr:ABC transporter ATP-binding protein [Acidimicrobiales bacterium]
MIRVEDLSVNYGAVRALRNVSFEAPSGQITAVLGANGAGKTTLLRTISGLVSPQSGAIHLDQVSLLGLATEKIARMGVGHVPEGRGVIEELTVEQNLRLGALSSKVNLAEGLQEQYARFPVLGDRQRKYCATLSGGERQMLAMARALIAKPQVLLLDEPSLGLAPQVTAQLMRAIRQLCETQGLTVILVEQNAKSALRIAHRALVLHLGSVVASGDAASVAADEDLRRYYLGVAVT